jgi:hypothetical protein
VNRPSEVKVTLALLARYAEVAPDSGLLNIVGGGIDVFGVARLPVRFPMAFALQFRYPQEESDVPREITFATRDPRLEIVGQPTTFEVTPRLSEYHAEGWRGIFAVTGRIDLIVESTGTHSIGIQIDGMERGDIPFQVFLVDSNNGEQGQNGF